LRIKEQTSYFFIRKKTFLHLTSPLYSDEEGKRFALNAGVLSRGITTSSRGSQLSINTVEPRSWKEGEARQESINSPSALLLSHAPCRVHGYVMLLLFLSLSIRTRKDNLRGKHIGQMFYLETPGLEILKPDSLGSPRPQKRRTFLSLPFI
jgi:hypothetical protein